MAIQTTNKIQTREELLQKAKDIGETAEKYALQTDEDRKLPDEVIEKIINSGFDKLHRPKAYGGQDLDFKTYGEIIRTIANHSLSAAWISYFAIIHETWAAFLPKEGREKLFETDALLADVFAPVGKVTNDPDGKGYRLSGTWNFCSGVLWSDWIGLCAIHQLRDGSEPENAMYIVHKDDVEIIDDWDTIGLRGTGSNTVKVDDVYVPDHLIFPLQRVINGAVAPDGNYEEDYLLFNVPYLAYFLSGFSQIAIGGLQRLVSEFEEKTKNRVRIYNNKSNEKDNSAAQHTLGEYKMQLNTLENIGDQYLEKMQYYADNGIRVLDEEEREQLFAMRGYVSRTTSEMATRLLISLGGNAIYRKGNTERFVRDLIAVAAHPSHLYNDAMVGYGSASLGFKGHPVW